MYQRSRVTLIFLRQESNHHRFHHFSSRNWCTDFSNDSNLSVFAFFYEILSSFHQCYLRLKCYVDKVLAISFSVMSFIFVNVDSQGQRAEWRTDGSRRLYVYQYHSTLTDVFRMLDGKSSHICIISVLLMFVIDAQRVFHSPNSLLMRSIFVV